MAFVKQKNRVVVDFAKEIYREAKAFGVSVKPFDPFAYAKNKGIKIRYFTEDDIPSDYDHTEDLHVIVSKNTIKLNSQQIKNRQRYALTQGIAHHAVNADILNDNVILDRCLLRKATTWECKARAITLDLLIPREEIQEILKNKEQLTYGEFVFLSELFKLPPAFIAFRLDTMELK